MGGRALIFQFDQAIHRPMQEWDALREAVEQRLQPEKVSLHFVALFSTPTTRTTYFYETLAEAQEDNPQALGFVLGAKDTTEQKLLILSYVRLKDRTAAYLFSQENDMPQLVSLGEQNARAFASAIYLADLPTNEDLQLDAMIETVTPP